MEQNVAYPPAPIPGDVIRSKSDDFQFISPCGLKQCTWKPGADMSSSPHVFKPRLERPKILPDVTYAIGNTPLIRLNKIPQSYGIKCEVLVKCEYFNPSGSVKDRIALNMLRDAETRGIIKPGDRIIEPTAGNTGLGLAMGAAIKGYKTTFVMPLKMSNDKVDALRALGADVVRTPPGELGSKNCPFNTSQRICKETPNAIILDQFRNASNPIAHYETTAEEILEQCDGKVDAIVCGSGTGGTMTGIGRKIKEKLPSCQMIGADPIGSKIALPPELNDSEVTTFEMEGIGFPFVPTTLDRTVVSKWYKISDKDSMLMARRLNMEEGILCGGSSGTAMCAGIEAAKTMSEGQRLVVILPDGLRNYMTKFASDPWMKIRDYIGLDDDNRWWWSFLPAKVLNLKKPDCVPSSTSCGDALQYMSNKNQSHLFIEQEGKVVGFITSTKMLSNLMALKYKFEDQVEVVMDLLRTVDDETPLGKICAIVDVETFVLVEPKINQPEEKNVGGVKYASAKDLLAYFVTGKPSIPNGK